MTTNGEDNSGQESVALSSRDSWNVSTVISNLTAILLAAFTGALICVGVIQSHILRAADQTSRSAERAFVYFENFTMEQYSEHYGVSVTFTNSGNTPARNVLVRFGCPTGSHNASFDPFAQNDLQDSKFFPPTYLGPKQHIPALVCELPKTTLDDAHNGVDVFVIAEVTYFDVFDLKDEHMTQAAQRLLVDSSGGRRFGFVGHHNCSDNDCPH